MSADPAVVQQEVDALRGSSPAELEALRVATAAKMRQHLDSLPEVADVPEAVAQIKTFIAALQARLDAIANLQSLAAATSAATPVREAPAPRPSFRAPAISIESTSSPVSFISMPPAAMASAPQPVLFNPTVVWGPPEASTGTSRTVLIIGALAAAALLILWRKS